MIKKNTKVVQLNPGFAAIKRAQLAMEKAAKDIRLKNPIEPFKKFGEAILKAKCK